MVASEGPRLFPGPCGVADHDVADLGRAVVACWDAFVAVVEDPRTDLSRPSRLPGWSGADTCVHLGAWDDHQVLAAVTASAAAGGRGEPGSPDADNARLLAAHRDASPDDVVHAVRRSRDATADWFASDAPARLGRAQALSTVGPLPALSLVHAGCFELAVHALDLAPCGAPPPQPLLLDRGLAALVDITGALSARAGVDITLTGSSAGGAWRFRSEGGRWTTQPAPPGPFTGVGVLGAAPDLLDAAAGRQNLAQLLLRRRLVVQQLPQWMRLAPLLSDVPGLPGGAALRGAVGGLGGVSRVLGRFLR